MVIPVAKPAPCRESRESVKPVGTIYPDSCPIFVEEQVLEQILDFSETDTSREIGGFLLGGLYKDGREFIEIRRFVAAKSTRGDAASLVFTHDTWRDLHQRLANEFPDDVVLGWHHTHPNFGVFLSAYDLFIHRNFFSSTWQAAMVVDPIRSEFSFFQWRREHVVDCGFFCIGSDNCAVSATGLFESSIETGAQSSPGSKSGASTGAPASTRDSRP
jgi:proteasome lid subunit RPN8/RPN11